MARYVLYLPAMTHVDVINKWDSLSEFAEDLGVPYGTAKAMRRRGSIPPEYWLVVVKKATDRALVGVTLEVLAAAVAQKAEVAA